MHAKYEVYISYGSKVIAKVKVDNRQTNKQTDRQKDRQTGQKQYAPQSFDPGGSPTTHLEGRIDPGRIGNKGETTHGEGVKLCQQVDMSFIFIHFIFF